MEKVYITKVLKNKESIHSIGFIDTESKKLYVPFVSKKGMSIVDTVAYDYITKVEDGYCVEEVVTNDEGRTFINIYYANKLK